MPVPLAEGILCAHGPLYENDQEIPAVVQVDCRGGATGKFVQLTRNRSKMDITEIELSVHDTGKHGQKITTL